MTDRGPADMIGHWTQINDHILIGVRRDSPPEEYKIP